MTRSGPVTSGKAYVRAGTHRWRGRWWAALALTLAAANVAGAVAEREVAEPVTGEQAEALVQSAFATVGDIPWYDAEQERLVAFEPPGYPPPRRPRPWAWPDWTPNVGGALGASALWRLVQWAAWGALLAFFFVVGIQLWRLAQRGSTGEGSEPLDGRRAARRRSAALQDLTLDVPDEKIDFWAEAQRAARSGNRQRALVLLYAHVLTQLDAHGALRLEKGKTNRQYLAELVDQGPLRAGLGLLVSRFEATFFGGRRVSPQAWEQCRAAARRMEDRLRQRRGAEA